MSWTCKTCGKPMRPAKTLASDHPGTVAHQGHGICKSCAMRTRRGTNTHGKTRNRRAKCGTYSGSIRHRRLGESLCVPCSRAEREYHQGLRERQKAAGHTTRLSAPINHGTDPGYQAHIRAKIPVCDACRDAHNAKRRAETRARTYRRANLERRSA